MAARQAAYYADEDPQQARPRVASASISSQLATWHANRGNKSFMSAMIPRAHSEIASEHVTRNPITLFRMVSLPAWLMFFSQVITAVRTECRLT